MDEFTRKCVVLVVILFCVTFAGIQMADSGLKRMKGYADLTYEEITRLTGTARDDVEETLFKKSFSIAEKKRQLEELKSFNALEGAGRGVTALVKGIIRICTNTVVDKIQAVFSSLGTEQKRLSYEKVR